MELIADVLLVAGSFAAAFYCHVLSLRLKRFTTLETGMGGAIAVLSAQVDDMTRALQDAQGAANGSASSLEALTLRGETVAKRLELLVASLHDLPGNPRPPASVPQERAEEEVEERRLRFVRRRTARDSLEAAE